MTDNIAQQINLLKRGTVETYREDELAQRLTEAAKAGRLRATKDTRSATARDPMRPKIRRTCAGILGGKMPTTMKRAPQGRLRRVGLPVGETMC